eukprot:4391441-Pyramimonas_sp.AAC.1
MSERQGSAMISNVRFQSGSRLPFLINLFHKGRLSERFPREASFCDECDGWAELSLLLNS